MITYHGNVKSVAQVMVWVVFFHFALPVKLCEREEKCDDVETPLDLSINVRSTEARANDSVYTSVFMQELNTFEEEAEVPYPCGSVNCLMQRRYRRNFDDLEGSANANKSELGESSSNISDQMDPLDLSTGHRSKHMPITLVETLERDPEQDEPLDLSVSGHPSPYEDKSLLNVTDDTYCSKSIKANSGIIVLSESPEPCCSYTYKENEVSEVNVGASTSRGVLHEAMSEYLLHVIADTEESSSDDSGSDIIPMGTDHVALATVDNSNLSPATTTSYDGIHGVLSEDDSLNDSDSSEADTIILQGLRNELGDDFDLIDVLEYNERYMKFHQNEE